MSLEERARELAAMATSLFGDIQSAAKAQKKTKVDDNLVSILAAPLASLVKMIIPNAHQKLDEIIFAASSQGQGLVVSAHQHGHDLNDGEGRHIELKTSTCTTGTRRCNFNWPIPRSEDPEARRALLIASIREKTRGGYAALQVKDGLQQDLVTYKLSEAFLVAYFSRLKLPKCDRHNMAAERCAKCHGFHRLQKLERASQLIEAQENKDVSIIDWKSIFAVTDSQCPRT